MSGSRIVQRLAAAKPHTPRRSLQWSLLLLGVLGAAYWFTQWPLPRLLQGNPGLNFYLVQPLLWTGIALLGGYGWLRLEERPPFSRLLTGIALLAGLFHVAVLTIGGLLWGFGSSPTAGRLINYPKNLLFITTLLAGLEVTRSYLYWSWKRWSRPAAFAGTALLLFAVTVPAAQWSALAELDRGVRTLGGRWIPALALSLLCTWMVGYGGIGPSFAYRLALLGFEWFSPLLPNLSWPILLSLGMAAPLLASWIVPGIYEETAEGRERHPPATPEERRPEPEPPPKWRRLGVWALTGILLLLGALFVTGLFGYRITVVDGRSMEPAFSRGDLLIVVEVADLEVLQVGDVIMFRQGNLPIVHRIAAIEEGAGGPVFITRGDSRAEEDPPVAGHQIEGKVVFSIPLLGYLNLWLRGR